MTPNKAQNYSGLCFPVGKRRPHKTEASHLARHWFFAGYRVLMLSQRLRKITAKCVDTAATIQSDFRGEIAEQM